MAKVGCECGNVLYDQSDFLPWKARILADEDSQKPLQLLADLLAEYMKARDLGVAEERAFLIRAEAASEDLPEETMVPWVDRSLERNSLAERLFSLMYPVWSGYDRALFECDVCGRLLLQRDEEYTFLPYLPEREERDVLISRHHHPPYPHSDA